MHAVIWASVDEWTAASRTNSKRCPKHLVSLQWHKPPHDTLKINVDGSLNHQGCIGAGGLIRNSNGAWCGGFTINLGTGDILQAEAWGLFYGLLLAIKSRAQKVEFESDSTILVNLIQQGDTSHHPLNTIFSNCRQLLCNFSSASLKHINREQNFAADLIAKASLSKGKRVIWLEDAPSYCSEAIQRDMSGASTIRIIPVIVDHGQLRGIHGDINAGINHTETSNNGNIPFQNCENGTTGQDQLMNPNFDEGVHGQIENLRLVVAAASTRSDIGASNSIISTTEGDITHGQCAPMCNGCLTSKLPPHG